MTFDIAIIGAGIAGASLAAAIGDRARVVLLEAEEQPGYHTTGRSAAFWSETYGGPGVQPLTSASGPFLSEYLSPRGELEVARADQLDRLERRLAQFEGSGVRLERLDAGALRALAPELDDRWVGAALLRSCQDIDVARLHQDYLAQARKAGASIVTHARLAKAERSDTRWALTTAHGEAIEAATLVDAAGAWADEVAVLAGATPLGIQPMRRTMVQLILDDPVREDMPLVIAADGSFYFKPKTGGRIWLSPHDETPCPPCDAQPEEIDIALAIDRFEKATRLTVARVERSWAGLRSFAPDRLPAIGPDPARRGFFWFAGQGGFGIQTAPAAAMIGAHLLTGAPMPPAVAAIDAAAYAPARFVR